MSPSCFDEKSLNSWLRKELPGKTQSEIDKHLQGCSSCQMMLDEMQFFEGALAQALICPDPEEMAQWLDGHLNLSKARTIQNHIAECNDCREMTEIVEAALEEKLVPVKRKKTIKRGQTRTVRPLRKGSSGPNWIYLVAPLAAAALILLLLNLAPKKRPNDGPITKNDNVPSIPKVIPKKNPNKKPDFGPKRDPITKDPKNTLDPKIPDPVKDPVAQDPDGQGPAIRDPKVIIPDPKVIIPDPKPNPDPDTINPKTSPSKTPKAKEKMSLASAGGALAVKKAGSQTWTKVAGTMKLGPADMLMARGDHAHFSFSKVQVTLRKGSTASLESQSETESRINLDKGEALFAIEETIPGHEFVAVAGDTETRALGTRFLIKKGRHVTVFVDVGVVSFGSPKGQVNVSAGQAFRIQDKAAPKAVKKVSVEAILAWSRAAFEKQVETEGLIYPGGFLAARSVEKLVPLLGGGSSAAVRARSLHGIRALQCQPDYKSVVAASVSNAKLAIVQAELIALGESELNRQSATTDLLQALIYDAFRRLQSRKSSLKNLSRKNAPLYNTIQRLSSSLADHCQTLTGGIDAQSLVALKLSSLVGIPKLKAEFWTFVGSRNVKSQGSVLLSEHVTLRLLPRKLQNTKNHARRLKAARLALDEGLLKEKDQLLLLQQAWVLEGLSSSRNAALSPILRRAVLDDLELVAADRSLLLSRSFQALLLGHKRSNMTGPRILVRGKKAFVSLCYKPKDLQKQVFLCGDWDDWNETRTPMKRQKDGSFKVLIELPMGGKQHYKFRDGDKDSHWHVDGSHKLFLKDLRNIDNSLLDLR
jgi:hypothetical protein